ADGRRPRCCGWTERRPPGSTCTRRGCPERPAPAAGCGRWTSVGVRVCDGLIGFVPGEGVMGPPDLLGVPGTPGMLSAGGFACAVVAVFWLPVVFGVAGILLGVAGHVRGE